MKFIVVLISVIFVVLVSGCIQGSLTPEDVLQSKDSLLGERITVIGTADVYRMICTMVMCTEDDPCCNACGGSLGLKDAKEKIMLSGEYEGVKAGCGGNNCEQTCHPLEIDKKYEVTGTWNQTRGEYYLEIEGFRGIE